MSITIALDDLPKLIFFDNINDKKLSLILDNLSDAKELFQFLVTILTKGIVLLFGKGSSTVSLDTLGQQELTTLKKKLGNAGIKLLIEFEERDSAVDVGVVFITNEESEPHRLEDYKMRITDVYKHIYVSFDFI